MKPLTLLIGAALTLNACGKSEERRLTELVAKNYSFALSECTDKAQDIHYDADNPSRRPSMWEEGCKRVYKDPQSTIACREMAQALVLEDEQPMRSGECLFDIAVADFTPDDLYALALNKDLIGACFRGDKVVCAALEKDKSLENSGCRYYAFAEKYRDRAAMKPDEINEELQDRTQCGLSLIHALGQPDP